MEREQILSMDPFMLLSWTNMKLRDQFDSLSSLCDDFNVLEKEIIDRLREIGYRYNDNRNQFIGI